MRFDEKNNKRKIESFKNAQHRATSITRNKEKGKWMPLINVYELAGRDLATLRGALEFYY